MASVFRSIHVKIILWALIPSFCVMGIITLLSLLTIKNTALDVVKKRDAVLAEFAAKRLSENLQRYPKFLKELAELPEFKNQRTSDMHAALADSKSWLHVFDGGIFFFEESGTVRWSYPDKTFFSELAFPDIEGFKTIKTTLRPFFSDIIKTDSHSLGFIIIAVPVLGPDNRFVGALTGVCSVNKSIIGSTYSKVLEYESGRSGYAFLVDGNSTVLYHRRSSQIGTKIQNQEVVQNVILGRTGAQETHSLAGELIISGFSPVPGTRWGIVTQGDWSTIQDLIQFHTRLSLFIIWSGGFGSALVVFYFVQRLLEPVRALTKGAERIANGNIEEVPVKKSNDEIEVLSRQFNSMARAMKAAFAATERKISQLDQAKLALSRSEERIRGITNAVNDIMLMVDISGRILWINDRGKQVFGEEAEGKKYYEIFYREQQPPDDCFVKEYFSTKKESDTELELWAEGKYQHYWCTANEMHWDHKGGIDNVVVVCRNLTEKKQLREEVLRNAQLAALGELAAGIAHEINNPINGIINYAQIIDDRWPKEDNPHAQLPGRIIKEGERIALIVSKLLSFARVDGEKKRAVAIQEIIKDALDLTGTMLKKEFIKVELDVAPDLPRCRAVVHQILQIILNIIGNARYALNEKYSGNDSDKKIVISCLQVESNDRTMVRVIFRDFGTGIARESIDKVCNPFYSTKPPGEGTGLGLSISHGIIEEHHGVFEVQSVQGQWTEVRIDLPVWR